MASSCVAIPTLTTTEVSTSQSLVITSTPSVSTGPSSVSTTVFRTCSQSPDVSSQCQATLTTSFITVPGNTTTVIVPATLTVDVPVTVSTVLFGSSCSSISSPPSSTDPPPISTPTSSTSTDSTDTPSTTTTPSTVVTTPPPTVITTDSVITSDGSTFLSYYTSTSTHPAVTINAQPTGNPSNKTVSTGPIVGGVVGGIAALLLLALLTWHLVKKQSKLDHFFHPDDDGLHHDHSGPRQNDPLLEKPSYQYGMVGQQSTNPVSLSPPHSPTVQNALGNGGQASGPQGMFGNDGGLSQSTAASGGQGVIGNDGGLGQASGQASGQTFGNNMGHGVFGNDGGLGQASGPPGALGTDGGLGQTVSGSQSAFGNLAHNAGNPSVIPLIVGVGAAAAASGAYATATSSRPSSSRPSTGSSSQALGPLVTPANPQGVYPPALQNWNATHRYGQAYAGPSTSSNNNNNNRGDGPGPSVGSMTSAYSQSSWVGEEGGGGGGVPGIIPVMEAARNPQQPQYHQQQPHTSLQVTNGADYEYEPYAGIGSSSSSMGAAAGPSSSSSTSQQAPSYDGKGRPLNMPPEKAPLVHLDGALYQQPPPRSVNEPPAYIE